MLGFTLPLAIILGLESFFALLLLGPPRHGGTGAGAMPGHEDCGAPPPPPPGTDCACNGTRHRSVHLSATRPRLLVGLFQSKNAAHASRIHCCFILSPMFPLMPLAACWLTAGAPLAHPCATSRAVIWRRRRFQPSPQTCPDRVQGRAPAGGEDGAAHGRRFPSGQPGIARV